MSRALLPLLAVACLLAPAAGANTPPASPLAMQAEALLSKRYQADGPGAAVLVIRDGTTLFRKGYGLASVELKVPVNPDMVFRIGSITKQVTAAATLLLVEDGKLDLQAPISRYLDKTPESWAGVTLEMLLNHTSGIPSYTDDPEFMRHFRDDFTPERLLTSFVTKKPLDFEPGTNHRYNNSGFYLLGMIIEKVSGQPWDAFMKKRIFDPLGMTRTRLGTETELIPDLVSGYTGGPVPAPYLSMTQPGAAGALVSTVDDLAKWAMALHGGKVIKAENLARMLAPTRTKDGKIHPYGFGIHFRPSQGHRLIGHGGGINGFVCYLETDPTTKTVAVILNNSDRPQGADDYYTRRLLSLAAGKPIEDPKGVPVPPSQLERLAGRYKGDTGSRQLTFQNGILCLLLGETRLPLIPLSATEFQVQGTDTFYRFALEGNKVLGLHRHAAEEQEGPLQQRVDGKDEPQAAPLDPAAFQACEGTYELAPNIVLKFWREGDRAFTQATGQPKAELFSENATTYFLKVVEAKVVFTKGADGKVDSLVLHQNGQQIPAGRVQ